MSVCLRMRIGGFSMCCDVCAHGTCDKDILSIMYGVFTISDIMFAFTKYFVNNF